VQGRGFLLEGELRKSALDIVEVATNDSIQQDDDTRSGPNLSIPTIAQTHQDAPTAPRRTKTHEEAPRYPFLLKGEDFYFINEYIELNGVLSLRHQE
jgi:hypothetical protein